MNELVLIGLDGGNPLGFLAALGTLRTLTRACPSETICIRWEPNSVWNPVLCAERGMTVDEIVAALDVTLRQMEAHPAFSIDDDLKIPAERFREDYAIPAAAAAHELHDRTWADFVAAFGSDATESDAIIQDTALRTMSGAGHQHFLKTMRDIIQLTTAEHLRKALFQPWRYEDDKPSLRWDPADDRRYALRWHEPSGDPIRTVRGANRLAIEALPLLPTMPVGRHLQTTGFTGTSSRDTYLWWPIWTAPIGVEIVRSLVALRDLRNCEEAEVRSRLHAMGIAEVYRTQRLTVGKFRNFAPAEPV